MNPITSWLRAHWLSIVVGVIICWLSIGINYAVFLKPSIKVGQGGKYIEAPQGYSPVLAVSAGDFMVGCAHLRPRGKK